MSRPKQGRQSPGISGLFHFTGNKSLYALLNLDPSNPNDRDVYDNAAVRDAVRRLPVSAGRRYRFRVCGFETLLYPLDMACGLGASPDVVGLLIRAHPRAARSKDEHGWTALHRACRYGASAEVVHILIDAYPAGLRATTQNGWKPLHRACANGAPAEVVAALVEAYPGALTAGDREGKTPLEIARENGAPGKVLELLVPPPAASGSSCGWFFEDAAGADGGEVPRGEARKRSVMGRSFAAEEKYRTRKGIPRYDGVLHHYDSSTGDHLLNDRERESRWVNSGNNAVSSDSDNLTGARDQTVVDKLADLLEEQRRLSASNLSEKDSAVDDGANVTLLGATDKPKLQPSPEKMLDKYSIEKDCVEAWTVVEDAVESREEGIVQHEDPVTAGREIMRTVIDSPNSEPMSIPLEYLEDSTIGFADERQLGEGSFSRVYMGKDSVLRRKFAVKRLKVRLHMELDLAEARKTFKREIVTLKHFRHPNIARLYAYFLSPDLHGDHCLVHELASHGSLFDYLKDTDQREKLHWTRRISIALDVAKALEYLHGGKGGQICFHRDVKSSNVCLKRDFTALLIDCGVAKMTPQMDSSATMTIMDSMGNGFRGTPGYICPAFARRMKNYSSAHDVFSLGVVFTEIFTGFLQNSEIDGEDIDMFDRYSKDGLANRDLKSDVDESAGEWDSDTQNEFVSLALGCISQNPRSRPKIEDIVQRLGNLASKARPWSLGERNRITVLSSAPLVFVDREKVVRPISELPNFSLERDLLVRCIRESGRGIELIFDVACDDRLEAAATKRCSCLHFSGHGHPEALLFEDSSGGAHWLGEGELLDCVHEEPFKFVFVSACYSLFMGKALIKAGVRHVVCCEQDVELRDDAALKFTHAFYYALAEGYTVKVAFQKGKMAVSKRFDQHEVNKFVLLPEDGVDHDVPLFNAELLAWKDETKTNGFIPSFPRWLHGREVDVYNLLEQILSNRLVNLVGYDGIERSNMATAVCHYINDRTSVMLSVEVVYFLQCGTEEQNNDIFSTFVEQLYGHLAGEGKVGKLGDETDTNTMAHSVANALKGTRALVVFDCVGVIQWLLLDFFLVLVKKMSTTKLLITSQEELDFSPAGLEACVFDLTKAQDNGPIDT